MTGDLTTLSIAEIRSGLRTRAFGCRELVDAYAQQIDQRDHEIQSFLHLDLKSAAEAADELDRKLGRREDLPALAGVVAAVKDNIAVRGMPATAGSKILEGYAPPYEATVVARLRRAGAIIIGKTNLDEFAMGASTEHSAFQATKNPHDPSRVPGGSSGGSAAAVAAGMCTVALGSDTGGSVRQPAAFCGLVGMRPTYGSVSRYGLIALASSMDVIGPFARTVADARAVLAVMSGYDPADATTLPHHEVAAAETTALNINQVRVGVPREYQEGEISPEVRHGFEQALTALKQAGASTLDVSLPMTSSAVPTYYIITPAEASSNLARYDGIRFGQPADIDLGHHTAYARLRAERFGSEPQRRLLLGTFTLSAGYADRYYHRAQRVRTLIRQDFVNAFERCDVLLTPTTPTPAFPLGSVVDPVAMYRQDIFLSAASLAGVPAISVPVPTSGLPVGVQLIAKQQDDDRLLAMARHLAERLAGRG